MIVASWGVMVYGICTPEDVHMPYIMTSQSTADLFLDHDQIRQLDYHYKLCFSYLYCMTTCADIPVGPHNIGN